MRRLELILGISFALVACRERTREPDPESLIEDVRIAGCEQIRRGPICEIENDTKVVLWVQAAPESRLSVEGTEVEWTEVDGGWRTTFEVTTATKSIDVIATRKGRDKYALPVVVWKRPPWLVKADALRTKSATTALAILDANEEGADVRTLADVATMRARIAMFRGRFDEAVEHRDRGVELGDQARLSSGPVYCLGTIAWIGFAATRDIDLARRALGEARLRLEQTFGGERAYIDFYEAVLARETGDARRTIRFARRAARVGERLSDPIARDAAQLQADVLSSLGLHKQVARSYQSIGGPDGDNACADARLTGNRAWAAVLARAAEIDIGFDAEVDARHALHIYRTTCPSPADELNLNVTLALAALQTEDLEAAHSHLKIAHGLTGSKSVEVAAWLHIGEAELAIRERRFDVAMSACEALSNLGRRYAHPALRWRASLCRAQLLEARGEQDAAVRAYEVAEQLLDGSEAMPFSGVGVRFDVDTQEAAARMHADILARKGLVERALAVLNRRARRARRGLERGFRIASLDGETRLRWERAAFRYNELRGRLDDLDDGAWSDASSQRASRERERTAIEREARESLVRALQILNPGDTARARLPEARPGEMTLTIDRLRDDWLVVGATLGVTRHVRLSSGDLDASDDSLARHVLDPFSVLLEGSKFVRVVSRGASHHIDVHRLQFQGRALGASHVVTYSADGAERSRRVGRDESGVLIIEDPTGNLPGARDEVERITSDLERLGRRPRTLAGRDATRRGLINAVGGASLLHWAGHGRDDPAVGFSAALPLAGRAVLDVGDILALSHVPNHIVLSGCTTAPTDTREIGPARAFVLAGASEVLATTRPVRDEDAALITSRLYKTNDPSLAKALQRAQGAAKRLHPASDWAAFRVYVP